MTLHIMALCVALYSTDDHTGAPYQQACFSFAQVTDYDVTLCPGVVTSEGDDYQGVYPTCEITLER